MKSLDSNQYYAVVVFLLAAVLEILALMIEDSFFSDPIGSGVWVQGVAGCLMILATLLFFFSPAFVGQFPDSGEWLRRVPFLATIIAYAYILPLLGYALATPILMTLVGCFFKARPRYAILSALLMTGSVYLIFDVAMGISLPRGDWWR